MTVGCSAAAELQRKANAIVKAITRIIATVHIILSLPCGEQKRQNLRIMKTKTSPTTNSVGWSPVRLVFLLILFVLALVWFALAPQAWATCQEGCLTNQNTVLGEDALIGETGIDNTAVGFRALFSNINGSFNTAIGYETLLNNTTGADNTAIGFGALSGNTTGTLNTATGLFALSGNSTGLDNTASGVSALQNNTVGNNNTTNGVLALWHNATGNNNIANGYEALILNTTGNRNTATGAAALFNNTIGSNNIALGAEAGGNLTSGDHNIDIGNRGITGEFSTIRIGQRQTSTYIAGISGATVPTGVAVIVDADGHLGTTTSSARYKESIHPMDKASEAILALKPVTFRYKKKIDPDRTPEFGLVAEDVEKVNPNLVARDAGGKAYTVRYDAVNSMLLNEFLKEHHEVQEQGATIARLEKQVEVLTAGLQKVSAQLEVSKTAQQVAEKNQ